MDLVNTTRVPATIRVATSTSPRERLGLLVAKASFSLEAQPQLLADLAEPVFDEDTTADDGLLPADLLVLDNPGFEVIALGNAHAPGGHPVSAMQVGLTVGPYQRCIDVVGDRQWRGSGIGPAKPFTSMPLTWARAFGGTATAWLDADTPLPIHDPINPYGRGFDPMMVAEPLGRRLRAPAEYPIVKDVRWLPNLEDPGARIRKPADRPVPVCWATTPVGLGVSALMQTPEPLRRCHPGWWLAEPPSRGATVSLHGMMARGTVAFALPALRVIADIRAADRCGQLELSPQRLVLRPERGCFQIVYRQRFIVSAPRGDHRVARIRVQEGWQEATRASV